MTFRLLSHEIVKVDGVAVHQVITVQANFTPGNGSVHAHTFPLGVPVKEAASAFAAVLNKTLTAPKARTSDRQVILPQDRAVEPSEPEPS